MMRCKSWILTDTGNDVWLDTFRVGNDFMRLATPHSWSITKSTLRGGPRDGIDAIDFNNGALSFTVLPTRGMGLWRGEYRGNFLGWHAPITGPIHPRHVRLAERGGLGWLGGFDELLCRCGLASNGPPGEDVHTDKQGRNRKEILTLHGRIANTPAHFVEVRVSLDPPHEISVTGQVEEGYLFFGRLRLTTTYTTIPGSNRIVIHDVVENRSAQPAELQLLYHLNLGPPFLEAGSRVLAPFKEIAPISPRAAEGIATHDTYGPPQVGYAEQVYLYDVLADAHFHSVALLYNQAADRGVAIRFDKRQLPCLTVWKNTAAVEDGYVTGLEPGTNYPNFKSFERQQGRVPVLPPGGRWEAAWTLEVQDSKAGVTGVLAEISKLQAQGPALVHRTPQSRFSPT